MKPYKTKRPPVLSRLGLFTTALSCSLGCLMSLNAHAVTLEPVSQFDDTDTTPALTRLPSVIREKIKDKIIEGMGQRIAKLNNYIEENI